MSMGAHPNMHESQYETLPWTEIESASGFRVCWVRYIAYYADYSPECELWGMSSLPWLPGCLDCTNLFASAYQYESHQSLLMYAVHPEYVVDAVRERYDQTRHPSNLHLYVVAAVGDGKGRGLGRLAAAGLVIKYTYAW